MTVLYRKHSKKSPFPRTVILILIGLIFFLVTSCSKEEKGEKQGDIKNNTTTDTSKTPQPVNTDKSTLTIQITKEGEILIQGDQFNLVSI